MIIIVLLLLLLDVLFCFSLFCIKLSKHSKTQSIFCNCVYISKRNEMKLNNGKPKMEFRIYFNETIPRTQKHTVDDFHLQNANVLSKYNQFKLHLNVDYNIRIGCPIRLWISQKHQFSSPLTHSKESSCIFSRIMISKYNFVIHADFGFSICIFLHITKFTMHQNNLPLSCSFNFD